jgi:hypothetical protein
VARSRREVEQQIRDLQKYLEGLPPRPDEPCKGWRDDNPLSPMCVRFKLRPGKDRSVYQYVAMRVRELWWVTGDTAPSEINWEQLWDWIERCGGLVDGPMEYSTNWTSVTYSTTEPPPDVTVYK